MKRSKMFLSAIAAGAVLGAGAVVAVDAGTGTADAQSGFTVSTEQLKINQRISSAAVKRSNALSGYLAPVRTSQMDDQFEKSFQKPETGAPGFPTKYYADGSIPLGKASPGLQNLQVYNANYYYNNGAPQQQGRALSAVNRAGVGDYALQWPIDVSACTVVATPAYYGGMNPGMGDSVQVYKAGNNNSWQVKYYGWDQATQKYAPKDGPFSVYVQCGTGTTSSN
jgi:hypothetical protein